MQCPNKYCNLKLQHLLMQRLVERDIHMWGLIIVFYHSAEHLMFSAVVGVLLFMS